MATVTADYKPSKAGWAAIALSPEILKACMAEAERGQRIAEVISPRESGEYQRSFDVEATTALFRLGPRVAAKLVNDSGHSVPVEFGNSRTPNPHRVLGRTAAILGASG